jgi:hypothetical protein
MSTTTTTTEIRAKLGKLRQQTTTIETYTRIVREFEKKFTTATESGDLSPGATMQIFLRLQAVAGRMLTMVAPCRFGEPGDSYGARHLSPESVGDHLRTMLTAIVATGGENSATAFTNRYYRATTEPVDIVDDNTRSRGYSATRRQLVARPLPLSPRLYRVAHSAYNHHLRAIAEFDGAWQSATAALAPVVTKIHNWGKVPARDRCPGLREAVSLSFVLADSERGADGDLHNYNRLWGLHGDINPGHLSAVARKIFPGGKNPKGPAPSATAGRANYRQWLRGEDKLNRATKRTLAVIGYLKRPGKLARHYGAGAESAVVAMGTTANNTEIQRSRGDNRIFYGVAILGRAIGHCRIPALVRLANSAIRALAPARVAVPDCRTAENVLWLPAAAPVPLSPEICLSLSRGFPGAEFSGVAVPGFRSVTTDKGAIGIYAGQAVRCELVVLQVRCGDRRSVQIYHTTARETVASLVAQWTGPEGNYRLSNVVRNLLGPARQSEFDQSAKRRNLARILRLCRSLPRVTFQDSRNSGNCEPGTAEFCKSLGLPATMNSAIAGKALAKLYRAKNRAVKRGELWQAGEALQTNLFHNALAYADRHRPAPAPVVAPPVPAESLASAVESAATAADLPPQVPANWGRTTANYLAELATAAGGEHNPQPAPASRGIYGAW